MVGKRKLRGQEALGDIVSAEPQPCPLCNRPMLPGRSIDEHHLTPRSQGGREKYFVHRICHQKIHATFSEKELAQHFHTWAALQVHEEIASFLKWVRKLPPEYYDSSRKSARRKGA